MPQNANIVIQPDEASCKQRQNHESDQSQGCELFLCDGIVQSSHTEVSPFYLSSHILPLRVVLPSNDWMLSRRSSSESKGYPYCGGGGLCWRAETTPGAENAKTGRRLLLVSVLS